MSLISFLALPDDCIIHIMSHLDFRDLIRCSFVCLKLNDLVAYDKHWKQQCIVYWDENNCPESVTWRQHFVEMYHQFGRYMNIYKRVRNGWNQIKDFLAKHNLNNILSSLEDGTTEERLDQVERKMNFKFPNELRCVLRFHNGQKLKEDVVGLLGSIRNYDHYRSDIMLGDEDMTDYFLTVCCLLPLTLCYRTEVRQFLCISDHLGFKSGHVYFIMNEGSRGNSLENLNCFQSATNYLDWFTGYAQELTDEAFPFDAKNIYKFYHEPSALAETGFVRVSVATAFIPEMSLADPNHPHYTHAYRVTMSMAQNVDPKYSCRLETRHWVITDANGKIDKVNGPGVIGEYPVMKPGERYSYISCTNFRTVTGEMKGTYTFRNLWNDETLEVVVPLFHMKSWPSLTEVDHERSTAAEPEKEDS